MFTGSLPQSPDYRLLSSQFHKSPFRLQLIPVNSCSVQGCPDAFASYSHTRTAKVRLATLGLMNRAASVSWAGASRSPIRIRKAAGKPMALPKKSDIEQL